ncbi:O-antigen ligase family protein [Anaerotalea alkaliphila]|uniref:O-antigen ligase domain-containing protein n=1 Tax=Anaerotalea alkaliphila TaxID=2662126 RepID=A0A7X5KKX3_9FIRM|nr:O-antigen ligase family protein [Anaerotalea alkaliphila]NDL66226.1 hypothetical protein [Anaerotalea alkaliphila]
MSRKNNARKASKLPSFWRLAPIATALALVPLFMRLLLTEYPMLKITGANTQSTVANLYTHGKALLLIGTAFYCLLFLLHRVFLERSGFWKRPVFLLSYAYMGLVVLSWVFSVDRFFSTVGYMDHHENALVLVAYVVIFLYASTFLEDHRDMQVLSYAWMVSIALLFLIGLTQHFGRDILMSRFAQRFYIPSRFLEGVDLQANITGSISQTLFNPNYVSFYASLALPFFLVLLVLDKVLWHRLLYVTVCLMMAFNLVASSSRNGLVGILASILLMAVLLGRSLQRKALFFGVLAASLALFLVVNVWADTVLLRKFKVISDQLSTPMEYPLQSIQTVDGKVAVAHRDFSLEIRPDPAADGSRPPFLFQDGEGRPLSLLPEGDGFLLAPGEGEPLPVPVRFEESKGFPTVVLTLDKRPWRFLHYQGAFYRINSMGSLDEMKEVPAWGFEGYERLGSSRGYIWSRSLPLLGEYFFFGSGPDTYPLVFPQWDRVGKLNGLHNPDIVVDKPHNILLNYGVNTGVPSLLLVLLLWFGYIRQSVRLYFGASHASPNARFGLASLAGVVGYLTAGLFNDTNVSITPLFWVLLGMGFAANQLYRRESNGGK